VSRRPLGSDRPGQQWLYAGDLVALIAGDVLYLSVPSQNSFRTAVLEDPGEAR